MMHPWFGEERSIIGETWMIECTFELRTFT